MASTDQIGSSRAKRGRPAQQASASVQIRSALERSSGIFVLLALILVFAIWVPDTFLTGTTAKSIASDQAITLILALGVLFVLAAGEFDLSIAQNLGLSAVIASSLMVRGDVAPVLAVVITLGVGVVIGIVNGTLVAYVGVNSFITTLGMSSVLLAATELISNGTFIGPVPQGFQDVSISRVFGLQVVVVYAVVIALFVWYVLDHTPWGRRIQALGANRDAARLAGVPTTRMLFTTFVIASVLASLAGVLVTAKTSAASPDFGPPYLLPAYAACFLGATQFKPGRFNPWGTMLAIVLLATGVKGLQLAGSQLWVTDLFYGVALVGAVTLTVVVRRVRDRKLREAADRSRER